MFYHCMHISCQVEVVLHVRAHKKTELSYPDALTTVVFNHVYIVCTTVPFTCTNTLTQFLICLVSIS